MIYKEIPPTTDLALKEWATTASTLLAAEFAAYGVTTLQAQEFSELSADYANKLTAAKTPESRTPLALNARDEAKAALLTYARALAKMIGGNPNVTNQQRLALGLHIPKPRTPQHAPTTEPSVDIKTVGATSVNFRVHGGDALVRRLPAGVMGLTVWTFIGDVPPLEYIEWQCQGPYTRPTVSLDFDAQLPEGGRVWIAACWFNRHGSGPMSMPVDVRLAGRSTVSQQMQMQMQMSGGSLSKAA